MNRIIPFKKEIEFNTKISEITSISLEHDIKSINKDLISGEFIIEGEYKIIEGSIVKEKYKHIIPFDIAIGSNYNLDNVEIDIDNFYYDVENNKVLKVNIDLAVNNIEEELEVNVVKNIEKEEIEDRNILNDNFLEENIDINNIIEVEEDDIKLEEEIVEEKDNDIDIDITNENINNNTNENNNLEEEKEVFKEINVKEEKEVDISKEIEVTEKDNMNNINMFSNLNMEESFTTYLVYFVKENDTVDKIINKYNISREDLESYNDLTNIKVNDKLIIPTHE